MRRLGVLWVILVVAVVGLCPSVAGVPNGSDITVDTTLDVVNPLDGVTSLREAILAANDSGMLDIYFDGEVFPDTIAVTDGPLPALTSAFVAVRGTSGGLLNPGDVVLDGSSLTGPDDHGIILQGSFLIVKGLKVTNFPGSGIFVGPGVARSVIDNILEGNGRLGSAGIEVLGSTPESEGGNYLDVYIENNTVTDHPGPGIYVCTTGGPGTPGGNEVSATIVGNTVTDAGTHGIQVVAGDGEGGNWLYMGIYDNTCTGAGGDGIRVDGGLNGSTNNYVGMEETIEDNVSTGNEDAGIGVYGGEGNNELHIGSISENDVRGNGGADWGAGIWVSAGGSNNDLWISQINSNDASNNGTSPDGVGIHVDGGDGGTENEVWVGEIWGNTIENIAGIGIEVIGGVNGNTNSEVEVYGDTISYNTITGGYWFGIWVLGGEGGETENNRVYVDSISNNTVSDNGVVNILVQGGNICPGSNRVSVDTIANNTINAVPLPLSPQGIGVEGGWKSNNNEVWVGSIVGNSSNGNSYDGINIKGGGNDAHHNTTFVDDIGGNSLTNNRCGIGIEGGYASSHYNRVEIGSISGNTATSNENGIRLLGGCNAPWAYTTDDGPCNNNIVIVRSIAENDLSGSTGAGINLTGSSDTPPTTGSHSNYVAAIIEGNTIVNNGGQGVNLALYNQGLDTTPSSFVYADLGGGDGWIFGHPGSWGGNTIQGNGASPADVVNNIPVDVLPFVMALGNTFDNVDPAAIDFFDVFDDDEDPTFGPVVLSEDNLFSDGRLQVARANVRRSRLYVHGWFKPNADGDGADITSEDVRVALFNDDGFAFSDTMPAGEINKKGRGRNYIFKGRAPGITKAKFVRWSGGRWLFTLRAKGIDASKFSKPVMLQLAVGDDQAEYSLGFIGNNNHK